MATAKKGKRKPAKKKAPKKKPAMSAQDFLEGIEADEDDEFSFYSDQMLAGDGDVARMGTGILAVDRLTGGGWPIGRMTELAAWEGIGKSTLIDQSIAETQRNGGRAALIDTENARDLSYMATLGVDLGELLRSRASTIEGCFKAIDRLLDRREQELATHDLKPMLIVWDSIGGTPTQKELDGGPEDGHMMGAARHAAGALAARTAAGRARVHESLLQDDRPVRFAQDLRGQCNLVLRHVSRVALKQGAAQDRDASGRPPS